MYVVAGSVGHTGSEVLDRLIERGQEARALVFRDSQCATVESKGAHPMVVDFRDCGEMTKALQGADAAYLLNPPNLDRTAAADLSAVLAKAVKDSGVPRVVFLSSAGAEFRADTGAALPLYDAERILREAAKSMVFLRPVTFMEYLKDPFNMAAGKGVFPTFFSDFNLPREMVSCRDIGRIAADALLESEDGEQIIELVGPREYSMTDVARCAGSALGKDVELLGMPTNEIIRILTSKGITEAYATLVAELYDWYNAGYPDTGQDSDRPDGTKVRGTVTLEDVFRGFAD